MEFENELFTRRRGRNAEPDRLRSGSAPLTQNTSVHAIEELCS